MTATTVQSPHRVIESGSSRLPRTTEEGKLALQLSMMKTSSHRARAYILGLPRAGASPIFKIVVSIFINIISGIVYFAGDVSRWPAWLQHGLPAVSVLSLIFMFLIIVRFLRSHKFRIAYRNRLVLCPGCGYENEIVKNNHRNNEIICPECGSNFIVSEALASWGRLCGRIG